MRPPQKKWNPTRIRSVVRYASGMYYLRTQVGGKRVMRSLGTKKESEAAKRAPRMIERLQAEAAGLATLEGAAVWTVEQAATAWVEAKAREPGIKSRTARFYRFSVPSLGALLGRPLRKVSRADVDAWWSDLCGRVSASRANGARIVLRGAVRDAMEAGWLASDPTVRTRGARPKAARPQVPTAEEFRAMLAGIASRGRGHEQTAAFCAVLGYAGLRVSEARALEWRDVRQDFLTVRGGAEGTKNSQWRDVPIVAALRPWLDSLRARAHGSTGPVFEVADARKALRPYGVTHHTLRHAFATRALESGVDVRTVAGWLGHQDGGALLLRTYAHLLQDHSLAQAARVAF